jgi:hypothetical protein
MAKIKYQLVLTTVVSVLTSRSLSVLSPASWYMMAARCRWTVNIDVPVPTAVLQLVEPVESQR